MLKQDIRILIICFRILRRLHRTGIPAEYCFDTDRLTNIIENNQQYRIILVCKAKHTRKLKDIMMKRCIHEIYILGHCPELKIPQKVIKIVNTNEKNLKFRILCATLSYTHDEEIIQRKLGNYGLANALAMDMIKLIAQIQNLL